jgi:predicted alpha/beta hydrolase family esterase
VSRLRCLALIGLLLLGSSGCGDFIDSLGTDTDSRVPHLSWNGYNLYQYAGGWQLLVDLGQPTGAVPDLGVRPVVIVHGLGDRIIGPYDGLAQNLLANGATSVFAFEYDTLDPIEKNGAFFVEALAFLTTRESQRSFRFVAHSLGCLVARYHFEGGETLDMAVSGNQVSLVAGPHEGTPVATELVSMERNLAQEAIAELVLNGQLMFFNSNGTPVDVMGDEPVFYQLVPGSDFLQTLNNGASSRHPQFIYKTMAGDERGVDYDLFALLIGVYADDGIVEVESANSPVVGQVQTVVAPYDHTSIIESQAPQLVILQQIGLL